MPHSWWYETSGGQLTKYYYGRDGTLKSLVIRDRNITTGDFEGVILAYDFRIILMLARFITFVLKETIIVICEAFRSRSPYSIRITLPIARSAIEDDVDIKYIFEKVHDPEDRTENYFTSIVIQMLRFMYPTFYFDFNSSNFMGKFARDIIEYIKNKLVRIPNPYPYDLERIITSITTEEFYSDWEDSENA